MERSESAATADGEAPAVVIVSNRGPISFTVGPDGTLQAKRGAGGLVSGIAPLVADGSALWIAAALSDGDRVAAASGEATHAGLRVQLVDIDPEVAAAAYNTVCNEALWYAHHALFNRAFAPTYGADFAGAWDAYRTYNQAFAEQVAASAPAGATILVQDYHLYLVASQVRQLRDDLRFVHFSHTPFAEVADLAVLPDAVRAELLTGLAGHDAVGFHSERWRDAYVACALAGGLAEAPSFVSPLGPDAGDLAAVAASDACVTAGADLDRALAGRRLIARVDRIELSKNIVRGFRAYEELLDRYREHRGAVTFGAFIYPSREDVDDYIRYAQEVRDIVARVNGRFGTPDWQPILCDMTDDFPRSIAALKRYDVLVVNPVKDGLNLVASEGPLLNETGGVVLLSTGAGAYDRLGDAAITIHAYDVSAAADSLHAALTMDDTERQHRSEALAKLATERVPADWFADQLAAGA